jgi:quinol monooxygenase YgiN
LKFPIPENWQKLVIESLRHRKDELMTTSETIFLVANLTAKTGKVEDLQKEIEAIIPEVQKEPGCISYHLHVDRGNPNRLVMLEVWENRAALDAHIAAAPFVGLKTKLDGLLAEPIALESLQRLK